MNVILYQKEAPDRYRVLVAVRNTSGPLADENSLVIEGEIPDPPKTEDGKRAVMYYNPISKEFWFEFIEEFMVRQSEGAQSEGAHELEARLDELLAVLEGKGLIDKDELQHKVREED